MDDICWHEICVHGMKRINRERIALGKEPLPYRGTAAVCKVCWELIGRTVHDG